MNIEKVATQGLLTTYKVVLPADQLSDKTTQQLKKIAQTVKLPGFRPGKVPEAMVRQRFLQKALEEVVNQMIHQAIHDIQKEVKRQASEPKIDVESFENDKDFICTITVEAMPTVEIDNLEAIEVETLKVAVSESETDKKLQEILKNRKKKVPLEKKRPTQKGDLVSVSLSATVDGKPYNNISKTVSFVVGDKDMAGASLLPNLLDSLEGKSLDESYDVTEKAIESEGPFSGKDLLIKVKIDTIEELHEHKPDADLAKEFGAETFDDFMKNLKEHVQSDYDNIAYLYSKRQLLDKLDEAYSYPVPPSMLSHEFDVIWSQFKKEYEEAKKNDELDPEDQDKSEESFKEDYMALAERRVRLGILMTEVSAKHKISLTNDEISMAVFQEAMRYPGQFKEVMDFYKSNRNALQALAAPVLENKVVDFILDRVKRAEKIVDVAELKSIVKGIIPTHFDDEQNGEAQADAQKAKPKASKSKAKEKE